MNQGLHHAADASGKLNLARVDLAVELLIIGTTEGEGSRDHLEEQDSKSPHISGEAVLDLVDDFWGHVGWSTAEDVQFGGWVDGDTETKSVK